MVDQKLIDDALKVAECCAESGRCGECPLDGHCLHDAPELNKRVIEGLLEDIAWWKQEYLYAKLNTVERIRRLLHKNKQWARNDHCDMDVVGIDDIDRILGTVMMTQEDKDD